MKQENLTKFYRVFVSNLVGCESTESEGNRVIQYLALNGHTITETPDDVDYIVVNTCAFLQSHRNAIVARMDNFVKQSPSAGMVVMGCVREIAPHILASYPTSLVCGHPDIGRLDSIFLRFVPFSQTPPYNWSKEFNRIVIPVGRGCVYKCSYCSIKKSIGFIKSRSIDAIVADVRGNLAVGNIRFLLAGDDLGSYGKDIHSGLPELLKAIEGIDADFSVLLSNIHPSGFLRYFEPISAFLASAHASKWLFLPIQSANQQVLASMRRNYSMIEVCRRVDELIQRIPTLRFYYDIIIGYPTETEAAFDDTLGVIMRHPPTCMMIAKCSNEEGTEAARLSPIADEIVKERVKRLKNVYRTICAYKGIPIALWGEE